MQNAKNMSSKQRLRKAIIITVAIIAGLLLYAAFVAVTGLAIPCFFHLATGLECPGCGVTRMCMALLHGDIASAASYNFAILSLLPVFAYFAARMFYLYVKVGAIHFNKIELAILWIVVIYLVIFGILLNTL